MENMEKKFYKAGDIMKIMDFKKSKAYEVIQRLNKELEEQGCATVKGRVRIDYFNKAFGIKDGNQQ